MDISVDLLVQLLQQIPGIRVVKDDVIDPGKDNTKRDETIFSPDVMFDKWARYWLSVHKMGLVKDNTFDYSYRVQVERHLIPYFGNWSMISIGPGDVQNYFKGLRDVLSLESQKKIRNTLRLIFEVAMEYGICISTPVTHRLKLMSNIKPIEKHTWNAMEYEIAMKYAMTHPCGLDVITLMETGITRSELLGLRWQDHDSIEKVLHINQGLVSQKSSVTGKYELVSDGLKNKYRHRAIPISSLLSIMLAGKPRTVFISGNIREKKPAQHVATEYIFHNSQGGAYDPTNWYRRVLKRFMKDLNEVHPEVQMLTTHELRHTRATLLKDDGVDLFSIAKILGHCDLNMLAKRYAHENLDSLRKAIGLSSENIS